MDLVGTKPNWASKTIKYLKSLKQVRDSKQELSGALLCYNLYKSAL